MTLVTDPINKTQNDIVFQNMQNPGIFIVGKLSLNTSCELHHDDVIIMTSRALWTQSVSAAFYPAALCWLISLFYIYFLYSYGAFIKFWFLFQLVHCKLCISVLSLHAEWCCHLPNTTECQFTPYHSLDGKKFRTIQNPQKNPDCH